VANGARASLSMSQIGQTLRRSPTATVHPDPIGVALDDERRILANQIVRRSTTEQETQELKARLEKMQTELELRKLESAKGGDDEGPFRTWLMGRIDQVEGEAREARAEAQAQREQFLATQLDLLRSELTALRDRQSGSSLVTLSQQIEEAKAVYALVSPPPTMPPAVQLTPDAATLAAYEKKLEYEHEERKWDREKDKDLEADSLRYRHEEAMAEIAAKGANWQQVNRWADTAFNQGLPIVSQIVSHLFNGQVPPTAAPQAAPMSAPIVQAPPGYESLTCRCGTIILYRRPGDASVTCQSCGTVYEWSDDPAPAPESPEAGQ